MLRCNFEQQLLDLIGTVTVVNEMMDRLGDYHVCMFVLTKYC